MTAALKGLPVRFDNSQLSIVNVQFSYEVSGARFLASLRSRLSEENEFLLPDFFVLGKETFEETFRIRAPFDLTMPLMRKGLFEAPHSSGVFINHFLSLRNPSPPCDYPLYNGNKVEVSQGIAFFRDLCRVAECIKPSMNCIPLNPETNEHIRHETKSSTFK